MKIQSKVGVMGEEWGRSKKYNNQYLYWLNILKHTAEAITTDYRLVQAMLSENHVQRGFKAIVKML